jgi:hypothetical protein
VTTPRVVASLAPAGAAAVRTRVQLERDGTTETIRDVKAPDLWAALKELLVLQSLRESEGAQALEFTLDQAVVNHALGTPAAQKLLTGNHLRSVDVAFSTEGIVVGVVPQLGPLKLPRRQYTIGLAARRGGLEFDLTEILRIPIAGSKIAAIVDAKAGELTWLSIRRRDNILAIGYPQLRCERAVPEDEALRFTLTAVEPSGDAAPRRRAATSPAPDTPRRRRGAPRNR